MGIAKEIIARSQIFVQQNFFIDLEWLQQEKYDTNMPKDSPVL